MAQSQEEQLQRVLVADDDQSIRQLVSTIVKRERLAVDVAADGLEAIEYLKKHQYAVILLDLMMPRMDGFGVIDWMKHNPPLIKPITVVITAYADQRFKEVDAELVSGVLHKPSKWPSSAASSAPASSDSTTSCGISSSSRKIGPFERSFAERIRRDKVARSRFEIRTFSSKSASFVRNPDLLSGILIFRSKS